MRRSSRRDGFFDELPAQHPRPTFWHPQAYQYVKQHYEPDRLNLVVLYPNGRNDDLGGGLTLSQLLERLQEGQRDDRKVRILTFGHGADADLAVLKQISDATGGVLFASPNPADIDRVFVTAVAIF